MFRRKKPVKSSSECYLNVYESVPVAARSKSMPVGSLKSIMKYSTADESIHRKYAENRNGSRGIVFKDIIIREYARTIGDNPSCSSGPPISISWVYNPQSTVIPVSRYEELRPNRRAHFEMILPRDVRQRMLRNEWDVTQAQIAAAVRANIKVKNQRRATFNNLDKATRMEEMMENAGKKLARGLSLNRSKTAANKQLEMLEKQKKQVNASHQKHQIERMQITKEDLDVDDDEHHYDTVEV